MDVLGRVPCMPGADSPELPGSLPRSCAGKKGSVMEGSLGGKFLRNKRSGEDENLIRYHPGGLQGKEAKRHGRCQAILVFRKGAAPGNRSSQMDLGRGARCGPGSKCPDVDLSCKPEFDPDAESVEKTPVVMQEDSEVKRMIRIHPGRCPETEGERGEVPPNQKPCSGQQEPSA